MVPWNPLEALPIDLNHWFCVYQGQGQRRKAQRRRGQRLDYSSRLRPHWSWNQTLDLRGWRGQGKLRRCRGHVRIVKFIFQRRSQRNIWMFVILASRYRMSDWHLFRSFPSFRTDNWAKKKSSKNTTFLSEVKLPILEKLWSVTTSFKKPSDCPRLNRRIFQLSSKSYFYYFLSLWGPFKCYSLH